MIKLLRQSAVENPWVFRVLMLLIAMAFVITMGWWGFSDSTNPVVARVDDRPITSAEYERAYRNAERYYRDVFKDQFNAEVLKQLDLKHMVINTLIERELWLRTARTLGVSVSSQELAAEIAKFPAFQRENTQQFDPDLYRRVLALNHLTPETFERSQREDLVIAKVKSLIGDSTAVTQPEWEEVRARQAAQNPGPVSDAMLPSPLPQKQERTLQAYMDHLRRAAVVEIKDAML